MRTLAAMSAAALVALSPAPAHAEPVPVDPGAGAGIGAGFLYLEVNPEVGPTERSVLSCPHGHGHARGEEACIQLTGVGGEIGLLEAADGMCTKEHAPVTLKSFGLWEGKFVYYEGDFGNHCEGMLATGGAVFDILES